MNMLKSVNQIGLVNSAAIPKKPVIARKTMIAAMTGPSKTIKNINARTAITPKIANIGKNVRDVLSVAIATTNATIKYQKLFHILADHPHSTHEIGVRKFKIHPIGPRSISSGK